MAINFDFNYSGLFVFVAAFVAAAVGYVLYFRGAERSALPLGQKIFLSSVRSLSVFLIFILFLGPITTFTKKNKLLPIIAVAFDNSQSILPYESQLKEFEKSVTNYFSDGYKLEYWSFGEKTEKKGDIKGDERRSDYGQMLKYLKGNYSNQNIGALIVIGDGIYNRGHNPVDVVQGNSFPVYTVGLGDTARKTDAIVRNVRTNKVAFLKNKFPVEIELNFLKLRDKIARISIETKGRPVYSGTVDVRSDDVFKLEIVNLEASEAGLQQYKVKIAPFEGETNLKNNEYEFAIQVLENKQKVLLLSDGPHPDLGALRTSLEKLQNYDIEIVSGNIAPESLSAYSLLVLNQIPSAQNAASKLLSDLRNVRVPVLFLIGPNSALEQVNATDMGLSIVPSKNTEEVQPDFDDNFSLFTLSSGIKETFRQVPPLLAPFGNTTLAVTLQNLSVQHVKGVPTAKTMIALGTHKGRKVGFIVGEGLWRWRLHDFKTNGNHEGFDELVQKIAQYLALKENEDNFNIYCPSLFQETDQVELTAELYNDSYQLVNMPDVVLKIKNQASQEFTYLFDRIDDFYKLNVGSIAPGDYTFEAETQLGNQKFSEKGSFSVVKNEIELQNNQADFGVLYQMAQQSGGKFASFDNYGTLLEDVKSDKQVGVYLYEQTIQAEWINMKFLFFIFLVLLGTEWFFRKYWGIY